MSIQKERWESRRGKAIAMVVYKERGSGLCITRGGGGEVLREEAGEEVEEEVVPKLSCDHILQGTIA